MLQDPSPFLQDQTTKTEQIKDKLPTAGQRAVLFRTLAIIGVAAVAAACGLLVCAPTLLLLAPHALHTSLWSPFHALRLHTFCVVQLLAVLDHFILHAHSLH